LIIYKFNTILFSLFVFTALQSCKEAPKSSSTPAPELTTPTTIKNTLPKSEPNITSSIPSSLLDWAALSELEKSITAVSDGKHQLLEESEEALKILFLNIQSDIPDALNTPSILARFKVLETLVYKLRVDYKIIKQDATGFEKTKLELTAAYSNLIFQISKTLEKESQLISKPN